MDKDIERRLDGWAGSYDWRRGLEQGEITEDELLTQLANLEEMEPDRLDEEVVSGTRK